MEQIFEPAIAVNIHMPENINWNKNDYKHRIVESHNLLHGHEFALTGWVDDPYYMNEGQIQRILTAAKAIQQRGNVLVVIGIGGSFLGTRAVDMALKDRFMPLRLMYAGWNTSSFYHARLFKELEKEDFSLCIISKSGKTTETMVTYLIFKEYLRSRYPDTWRKRITVVSESMENPLWDEGQKFDCECFEIPYDIGGRYSVLTAVGLLPLAASGVDIHALLHGASEAYADLRESNILKNQSYQYAAATHYCYQYLNKRVEVLSTTEPELYWLTKWIVQLIGESEGKNAKGYLPIPALYSTDFHSLGQYFNGGPDIYTESFFYLQDICSLPLSGNIPKCYEQLNHFVNQSVFRMRRHTLLNSFGLARLCEKTLGYMLYFFMKSVAMRCMLSGTNPFDQPGVEEYKQEMKTFEANFIGRYQSKNTNRR